MPTISCYEHTLQHRRNILQLYCFPYAGGNAQIFNPWKKYLPSEIDLCKANLPGRGKRMGEPPATRLGPLVTSMADALIHEMRVPYALFGHSMGAMIVFELARELRRRKASGPAHIFVAGRRAPQWVDEKPNLSGLPPDEFASEVRKLNGTQEEFFEQPELMEMLLPLMRADFEMIETYQYYPEEPLACRITAYGGISDTEVTVESLKAWQQQTSSKFILRMLPGDHFFIRDAGFPGVLVNDLNDLLKSTRLFRAGSWPV